MRGSKIIKSTKGASAKVELNIPYIINKQLFIGIFFAAKLFIARTITGLFQMLE
jgi:hypothetical protein